MAHSLGTLTAATWLCRTSTPVRAVVFVAPPDPHRAGFPAEAGSFADLMAMPLSVPGFVVASIDDPDGGIEFFEGFAARLRSPLRSIGARGHINHRSGPSQRQQGRDWD